MLNNQKMNLLEKLYKNRFQNKENFKSKDEADDLWSSISKEIKNDKTNIDHNKFNFNKWTIGLLALLISLFVSFLFFDFAKETISLNVEDNIDIQNAKIISEEIDLNTNKVAAKTDAKVSTKTESLLGAKNHPTLGTKNQAPESIGLDKSQLASNLNNPPILKNKTTDKIVFSNSAEKIDNELLQEANKSTSASKTENRSNNNSEINNEKKNVEATKNLNTDVKSTSVSIIQGNVIENNSNSDVTSNKKASSNNLIETPNAGKDEIVSFNFLENSKVPFLKITDALNYEDYVIKKIDLTQDSKDNYLELGLNAGLNYFQINFSNSEDETNNINLINKAENGKIGAQFAIDAAYIIKRKFKFGIGLEYGIYNSKLQYQLNENNSNVTLLELGGDQFKVDTIFNSNTTRNVTKLNRSEIISLPIEIGFQKSNDARKWMYGISVGPLLNFRISQKGRSMNGSGLYNYDNNSADALFKSFGIGFRAKVSLGYRLNSKIRINLEPEWNTFSKNKVKDITMRTQSSNLKLSIKYRFNNK